MDLKERYIKEVVPALMTKFGYKSIKLFHIYVTSFWNDK